MSNDIISLANEIATSKENIRLAINTAGVDCPEDTPFANYASKISQIQNRIDNVGTDIFYRGSDSNLTSETTSYTVPSNYAVIGNGAMTSSTSLQTLSMPNVTVAFDRAFAGCQNLTTINAPMCKYYGDNALWNTGISGAYTNDVAEHFGNGCFQGNKALKSVSLPNAKELGANCFYGCNKVENISIPKVESIGCSCFENFGDSVIVDDVKQTWNLNAPCCKRVGESACYNNVQLENISLPNVKFVGEYAFYLPTTNLKSETNDLYIPSCEYIGKYAFHGRKYPNIIIKDGCSIGDHAFSFQKQNTYYPELKTVIGKPSFVDSYAFYGCTQLKEIDLSGCVNLRSGAFYYCNQLKVIDLSSCKNISKGSSSDAVFYKYGDSGSCVAKVWMPSTIDSVTHAPFKVYTGSNGFEIYTDLESWSSRPSGWTVSQETSCITWHYGATYQDFLNAVS